MMRYATLCSGIGAPETAWQPLGWECAFHSEIEPFPCSVLAHHNPDVPNYGDMTKYKEWKNDGTVDLICAGTPCQPFSVAGLRKGLDDPRGNLMLVFGAIAAKYRPRWLVWENVPGVLSSEGGKDFASFLGLLTGQSVTPPADGWQNSGVLGGIESAYGVAWRILDAQYFGVAQRRRRVFVVGYLGDWHPAAAVLFERESLQGHPAPSREKGQGVAGSLENRSGGGGFGTDFSAGGGCNLARSLRAKANMAHREDADTLIPSVCGALSDGAHNGGGLMDRTPIQDELSRTYRMTAFGEYADDGTASAIKQRDFKDATDLVVQ